MRPMLRASLIFPALLLIVNLTAPVQSQGREALSVPFTIERNRILIPTAINGSQPQRIILDTGMRFDGVYLFHREALKLIDTAGAIEVRVPGAGSGDASKATMIEAGRLEFGDVAVAGQRILVSHSEQTQTFPTDGVIGWNLFGHYIVEIDYDLGRIFLRDSTYVASDSSWLIIPVEMKDDLPFLDATVEVIAGETVPMKVYIDLASGEALELLTHQSQRFTMPDSLTESNLGTGLSGDISGYYGRSVRLKIGEFELRDIRTAFAPAHVRSKQKGAAGILGNDVIRRFNIIFDYFHSRLYLKPNTMFSEPFD